MNDLLKTFRQELLDELEHDILPFWTERVMAPAERRFYGRIAGDGTLYPDADQSAVLYGRLIWTFSAAYRMTGRRSCSASDLRAQLPPRPFHRPGIRRSLLVGTCRRHAGRYAQAILCVGIRHLRIERIRTRDG